MNKCCMCIGHWLLHHRLNDTIWLLMHRLFVCVFFLAFHHQGAIPRRGWAVREMGPRTFRSTSKTTDLLHWRQTLRPVLGNMFYSLWCCLFFRWFEGFNWDGLGKGTLNPPIIPKVRHVHFVELLFCFVISLLLQYGSDWRLREDIYFPGGPFSKSDLNCFSLMFMTWKLVGERIIFVCSLIFYENVRKKQDQKLLFFVFFHVWVRKKHSRRFFFPCVKVWVRKKKIRRFFFHM